MKNKDLEHINSIEGLRAQIKATRADIRMREQELAERWSRLPGEAFNSAVRLVVTSITNKRLLSNSAGLVKNIVGIIFSIVGAKRHSFKENAINIVKQIGFYAVLKSIFLFWKKRRKTAKES